MRSGEKGMGSDGHISSLNQSSYFCLSFLTALLSSWKHWMLEFTPSPKLPSFCVASFPPLSVHQPRLVITISPAKCATDLCAVMMMEVALNRSTASVTDRAAALTANKGQNDWEETLLIWGVMNLNMIKSPLFCWAHTQTIQAGKNWLKVRVWQNNLYDAWELISLRKLIKAFWMVPWPVKSASQATVREDGTK